MKVFFGEVDKLKSFIGGRSGIAGGVVIPITEDNDRLAKFGVYLPADIVGADLSRWVDAFNHDIAKYGPLLLNKCWPDSFPIGPWSMTHRVSDDRRFGIALKQLRSGVEDFDMGATLARYLPEAEAARVKPIRVRAMYNNRYRTWESSLVEWAGGKKLPFSLALLDVLTFPAAALPDSPLSQTQVEKEQTGKEGDPLSMLNPLYQERIIGWLMQNKLFEWSGANTVTGVLARIEEGAPDLGWSRLKGSYAQAEVLDGVYRAILEDQHHIKLYWFNEPVAYTTRLDSRWFFPEGPSHYLNNLIHRLNGSGIIHPLFDGLLPERRPNIKLDIESEIRRMVKTGMVTADSLGHLRVVYRQDAESYLRHYQQAEIPCPLGELEHDILKNVVLTRMLDITEEVNNHRKELGSGVEVNAITMPNISGMQTKFAASLQPARDGSTRIVPASGNGVFSHIIKPGMTLSMRGDDLMPFVEWLGMRAAKAAGLRTSKFALALLSKVEIDGVNQESHDKLTGAFDERSLNIPNRLETEAEILANAWTAGLHGMFISERFDIPPRGENTKVIGIDIAQVMGVDVLASADNKYRSSYEEVAATVKAEMQKVNGDWESEKHELFRQLLLSWMIGDSDLHLKNLSLLYSQELDNKGRFISESLVMAPAYDRVTVFGLHKDLSRSLAMPVSGVLDAKVDHWLAFAENHLEIPRSIAYSTIHQMGEQVIGSFYEDLVTLSSGPLHYLIHDRCAQIYDQITAHFDHIQLHIASLDEHKRKAQAVLENETFEARPERLFREGSLSEIIAMNESRQELGLNFDVSFGDEPEATDDAVPVVRTGRKSYRI